MTKRIYEVDDPIHLVCSCGEAYCVAPPPLGCDGTIYDPDGNRDHLFVDLLGFNHINHTDDCGCVFEVKRTDVTPR